ncbi:hypothetical protein [Staphylospora marina]|uniref:hypothetical protein n=1 Tax=Staphylospora marina TaxID=2490858 RepID=UPI000F5BB657|nr:hypothetical protein [Staphylospora marina]
MLGFHLVIVALFLLFGIWNLFVEHAPVIAVHFFLVALYFFLTYFELKGQPFSRLVYLLAIALLVMDGILNLFFIFPTNLLSGVISFFFAFLAWQSVRRLQQG